MPNDRPAAICRSFRQDFPEYVDRADALGVRIRLGKGKRNGRARVFWLDGYRQLTGYTTKKDGSPFTHEDAARNIDKALSEIAEDRQLIAAMSVADRFARIMRQFRQMAPQYRMIGEVRLPGGDCGHCFFNAAFDGGAILHGIGDVARGNAEWRQGETQTDQMARFCDALAADFARRSEENNAGEDA